MKYYMAIYLMDDNTTMWMTERTDNNVENDIVESYIEAEKIWLGSDESSRCFGNTVANILKEKQIFPVEYEPVFLPI